MLTSSFNESKKVMLDVSIRESKVKSAWHFTVFAIMIIKYMCKLDMASGYTNS
jgi:hypothetical protein